MNKLFKALIYNNEVSLSVLDTTQMVNDAIKVHALHEGAAKTLGGLLTAAAYMAGCLKSESGSISLTIKGGNDSGTVSVSADKQLHIRGYIDDEYDGRLKGGTLAVIKEDGLFRPFIGTCELVGDDVSENLMNYFQKSEQIDTAVAIGVKIKDGKCISAGGVIMQLLPGTAFENMERAEERMQAFVNVADVVEKYGADGIIKEFFKEELQEGNVYEYFPEYKCNCSREKTKRIMISLGREEVDKIIKEEGEVKVHCHYCNTDYIFKQQDIDEIFTHEEDSQN